MPIRLLSFLITAFLACSGSSTAQGLEEKMYKTVVENGISSGPELIVVTVKNLNTGKVKEICTNAVGLHWSVLIENHLHTRDEGIKILLAHITDRTFEFRSEEALERLRFDTYKLKHARAIAKTIKKDHLVDSLLAYHRFIRALNKLYLDDYGHRKTILNQLKDSISKLRPLTDDETEMLRTMWDRASEYNYTPGRKRYEQLSDTGKNFLAVWNRKMRPYKKIIDDAAAERKRMNEKFLERYLLKYGISFCHVAYKYGIVCGFGDIDPSQHFAYLVTLRDQL